MDVFSMILNKIAEIVFSFACAHPKNVMKVQYHFSRICTYQELFFLFVIRGISRSKVLNFRLSYMMIVIERNRLHNDVI